MLNSFPSNYSPIRCDIRPFSTRPPYVISILYFDAQSLSSRILFRLSPICLDTVADQSVSQTGRSLIDNLYANYGSYSLFAFCKRVLSIIDIKAVSVTVVSATEYV